MSTPRKADAAPRRRSAATKEASPARSTPRKPTRKRAEQALSADAPTAAVGLVLSGPPGRLRATVSVANTGDRALPLEAVRVLVGESEVVGTAAVVVAPRESAQVPVLVSLAPDTAPGEYPAQIELAGVTREATVRVEPHLAVSVSPATLVVGPGTHEVMITLTNTGNVPLALATRTRARTDDGGSDPGPDISLRLADPPTVEPGGRTSVVATLAVPDLDPTRRHTARLPVGLSDITVHVLPRTTKETS